MTLGNSRRPVNSMASDAWRELHRNREHLRTWAGSTGVIPRPRRKPTTKSSLIGCVRAVKKYRAHTCRGVILTGSLKVETHIINLNKHGSAPTRYEFEWWLLLAASELKVRRQQAASSRCDDVSLALDSLCGSNQTENITFMKSVQRKNPLLDYVYPKKSKRNINKISLGVCQPCELKMFASYRTPPPQKDANIGHNRADARFAAAEDLTGLCHEEQE
uniref:SFRICE_029060 n=1 Tax=Spodoptera frugiperda TaxID=7108 RepID=A0A2H1VRC4_SPOFR